MIRPLVHREFRIAAAGGRGWPARCIRLAVLTGLGVSGIWVILGPWMGRAHGHGTDLALAAAAGVGLLALLAPLLALARRGRGLTPSVLVGPWPTSSLIASRLAPGAATLFTGLASSFVVTAALSLTIGDQPPAPLAAGHVAALAIGTCFLLLGVLSSIVIADRASAFALCLLVGLLLIFAPLLAGPVIERSADASGTIETLLSISPPTAMAAVLGHDVMRFELLYRHSPIGQRRFSYPRLARVLLTYLGASAFLFATSVACLAKARRNLELR